MIHGQQRGAASLSFELPAKCADRLAEGSADVGLVPLYEIARLGLEIAPGTGIACRGSVRSILLITRVPVRQIRTLATDASSRTSVELARVVLEHRYGVRPKRVSMPPVLSAMLDAADAALVIGDPALHVDPASLPFECLDLGEEWYRMTGLPFVFAAWAGRPNVIDDELANLFVSSYHFGRQHLEEIIRTEAPRRGLAEPLVRDYLTRHIVHELGAPEYEAIRLFLQYAGYTDSLKVAGTISV